MKKIIKNAVALTLLIVLSISLVAIPLLFTNAKAENENKILFEYESDKAIAVTDSIEELTDDVFAEEDEYSMQVMFKYDYYNDAIYDNNCLDGESYVECSKRYHTNINKNLISKINTNDCDVFISEYTPYVFINFRVDSTINKIYTYAKSLSKYSFIDNIRIFPTDIYNTDLAELEAVENEDTIQEKASTDSRVSRYENFPKGTPYTGRGIKIGLLDTGKFDTSHPNFSGVTVETVYDTYTDNDGASLAQHPTLVASVLGGEHGYASAAGIYYVDVNSESGYVGIERLINKGVDIVNMSISNTGCANNGEYDTGSEGYLDYIYTSTKVIMVASAGNFLNKEGSGGYVALPALCANVISVGSVTSKGIPSDFSCYNIKNDVNSNPNLVAVGSSRYIGEIAYKSGTSFSAPAVTGALALYFEKNGVKELPAVLAVLSATADSSAVDTTPQAITMYKPDSSGEYVESGNTITCTNNLKANGTYERTGAGILDVTALLNYSNTLINYEVTFTSDEYVDLKTVYLEQGQTINVSIAWQRNATLTINKFLWWETGRTYSSNTLPYIVLYLCDSNGSIVDMTVADNINVGNITYTNYNSSGNYVIQIQPHSNYSDTHNINYAYVIK